MDIVAAATEKMLITEALLLKRLGIDDVPIPVNEKKGEHLDDGCEEIKGRLQFLSQYDDGQDLHDLVRQFTEAATSTTIALHKEIETVPQNRPFGGSAAVERLMVENLHLMNEILEYDDRTSGEYWSQKRIEALEESKR